MEVTVVLVTGDTWDTWDTGDTWDGMVQGEKGSS